MAEGAILFRPGDEASGFVLVREGVIDVHLTGRSGREITLYTVEPGQTCVQTTLCLLGEVSYSAEAIAVTPIRVAIVPVIAIAGALAAKPRLTATAGSLPTHGALFIGLLIGIVLILGGLQFFPALALGPIVEHFQALQAVAAL